MRKVRNFAFLLFLFDCLIVWLFDCLTDLQASTLTKDGNKVGGTTSKPSATPSFTSWKAISHGTASREKHKRTITRKSRKARKCTPQKISVRGCPNSFCRSSSTARDSNSQKNLITSTLKIWFDSSFMKKVPHNCSIYHLKGFTYDNVFDWLLIPMKFFRPIIH